MTRRTELQSGARRAVARAKRRLRPENRAAREFYSSLLHYDVSCVEQDQRLLRILNRAKRLWIWAMVVCAILFGFALARLF